MNKIVLLILTGTLAFLTGSCSFFSSFADSKKDLEKEAAQPIPANIKTAQDQLGAGESEEFADLESEVEPSQAIAGLIPATNPEVRVRSSIRGRQDPFSAVNLTPRIVATEKEQAKISPDLKPVSNSSVNNQASNNYNNGLNGGNLPSLPVQPPQPTLAQNVVISGLYKTNGVEKLIVKAPNEDSSRYVSVGEYLSDGQILVKRIDLNHSPTPLVILEQSGIQVSKEIGEKTEAPGENQISLLPAADAQDETLLSELSDVSLNSN